MSQSVIEKTLLRFRRWEGTRGHYAWEVMRIRQGDFLRHSYFIYLFTESHFTDLVALQMSPGIPHYCPILGSCVHVAPCTP